MTPADFELYRDLLKTSSGLSLTPEKTYLLESRLQPLAQKNGYDTLDAMTNHLRQTRDAALHAQVVEAMTTNETLFFRDERPFRQFRTTILPELIKRRHDRKHLRIWSAACSTGQEAYSLAMILDEEKLKMPGWKIDIIGTDIAEGPLQIARNGLYNQFEVQRGLPIQMAVKYFEKNGEKWQIKPEIRQMVRFQKFNLLHNPEALGKFDIIFCRNVLIYFDKPTKAGVLRMLSRTIPADGYVFLGAAETALGLCHDLEYIPEFTGLFRRMNSPAQALG